MKKKSLTALFLSNLYISAFTFGGGFVIVSLMKKKYCDELGWLDEKEMLDIAAIAESSPGAIAVNASIMVGWKLYGFAGMLISVLGTILPPVLILMAVSRVYEAFITNRYVGLLLQGMQAGVAAVLLEVVINLFSSLFRQRSFLLYAVTFCCLILNVFLNIGIIQLLLLTVLFGLGCFYFNEHKGAFR